MSDTNVRLQNLRDFTVQIRNANDQIVGTGIAVSTDGKIVTCVHVIEAAGVNPRNSKSAEINVYFPQARGGEEKKRNAKVLASFPEYDDDVVILQVTNKSIPLGPENLPILGTAEDSQDHPFRSYGYRRLQDYLAGWAHGTINGSVEGPLGSNLQIDPVQLTSSQINAGMSGSAVLDKERNLVVGIISETWIPDATTKDRDTGWAVNAHVLSLEPLGLALQDEAVPLRPAPEPKTDEQTKQQVVQVAQVTVAQRTVEEKYSWNNAPSVLLEWTGRDHLLKQITSDWNDLSKHVTGLIGFGGEGKSSLARKWVDTVISHPPAGVGVGSPDGVFWWGFYENRSVDEFLEAALKYMSGGRIDPRAVPSSNLRTQIIGAMLNAGRYLFVLDGLEVMQHQEGDQYGLLQSNDLRDLLTFFARPDNKSFCLVTSRAPVLDLMEYTTYTHRDVDRLSNHDGRALLRRLGVNGSDAELNNVIATWDGHALTLSLVGSYLVKQHDGDVRFADKIRLGEKKWVKDAPEQYKHVSRILRRYDEHLGAAEKAFLLLFSAFRAPIHSSAFKKVFRKKTETSTMNEPLTKLRKPQFDALVERLVRYRMIRHDAQSDTYTTHPLIRNHYFALLTKRTGKRGNVTRTNVKRAHEQIKDYYLSIAGDTPQYPTLDDLKSLIEVVHHACQAGVYDDAFNILWNRIYQTTSRVLIYQLGSYETNLNIMLEFFPDGDALKEPQTSNSGNNGFILNEIGFCLMSLGRLHEAVPFFERYVRGNLEAQDWQNASIGYQNLADLYASLGALEASAEAARQALDLARRAENKWAEGVASAWQGWAKHLLGDLKKATSSFASAEKLYHEDDANYNYLYSKPGIHHADHLRRRTGQADYARRVTEANLQICEQEHWADDISRSYRVLGDLDSDAGNYASARAHYESALKKARGISARHVLIEALLARGRWQAKHMKNASDAFSDLNEALDYCVESGYRIYEADVRVALAWAYLANSEKQKAKESAERALQMSNEMGYHCGKVDAEEELDVIARSDPESEPTRLTTPAKTKAKPKAQDKRRSNLK